MPTIASETAPAPDLQMAVYTQELKGFLERLPRHVKRGRIDVAREQCERVVTALPKAKSDAKWADAWARMHAALDDLRRSLDGKAAKAYVLARYDEAARAYEHWLAVRRQASNTGEVAAVHLGSLKPLIGARTIFHMTSGVVGFVCYQFLLTKWQCEAILLTILGTFTFLEITRRIWPRWNHFLTTVVFKKIARPREYYFVNSSSLYVLGLALLVPVFSQPAVISGVLILAFADPAAAWIGKRWGKLKLYQSKSLAGSLAFVGAGTIVAAAFLLALYPQLGLGPRLAAALCASVVGSVAELFSTRIDDNLTIPIASTLVAALFI